MFLCTRAVQTSTQYKKLYSILPSKLKSHTIFVVNVRKILRQIKNFVVITTNGPLRSSIAVVIDNLKLNENSSTNGSESFGGCGVVRLGDYAPNNDLLQIMNTINNELNVNPPPPPPLHIRCGDLRAHHAGIFVEMTGRLIKKRLTRFMELRDRGNSACQLVVLEERYPQVARRLINVPENTIVSILGLVTKRPRTSCNQTMLTGEIEVEVQDILAIHFSCNSKRTDGKRSYKTMSHTSITSTEYKMAETENLLKQFENRYITSNDLRRRNINTSVVWVPACKSNKFMQLKDGHGEIQIMFEDKSMQDAVTSAPEGAILQITGKVLGRHQKNINIKYDTGEVEIMVRCLKVLNPGNSHNGPIKPKRNVKKLFVDDIEQSVEKPFKYVEDVDEDSDITCDGSINIKVADLNKFTNRTHTCGELTSDNIGEKVIICGWLEFQRMGKFIVLRDGYGQTQVLIVDKTMGLDDKKQCINLESIVKVEGTVIPRPAATINDKMKTGHIEVEADSIEILNPAKQKLPFELRKFNRANEHLRLKHRYIDLRYSDMQYNLRLRSQIIMRMREYLINYLGFVEVETPTLFRRTPGGAQEFVVPTRKSGHFYSLVQSPQQFKQMLMVGAIDRYFQVARCYRDEATRPDRQPEFTQLDIELSFTNRDDIMQLVEKILCYSWPKGHTKFETPFKRITYKAAMEKFGTDKPDTRFNLELTNVTAIVQQDKILITKFKNMAAYALIVRGSEGFWNGAARKRYDGISKEFLGIFFVRKFLGNNDLINHLSKTLNPDIVSELILKYDLGGTDLLFLGIGEKVDTQKLMGKVRVDYQNFLIENGKTHKNHDNQFVWVTDFPMFERNPETGNIESVHHPFTAPHPEDFDVFINLKSEELLKLRSQAYDLVLNGQEVGGGSMRIHDRDMQHFVLDKILKIPHDHLAHLLSALESGCPPHGGIALGLDRLISIICGAISLRDVIAFPKSLNGRDPLSNAPVPLSEEDKILYSLSTVATNRESEESPDEDSTLAPKNAPA